MPQPRPPSTGVSGTTTASTVAKRGREQWPDSQLTDAEFRRLVAKRLNAARRARVALCNSVGTTLVASALIGAWTLQFLIRPHQWSGAETATIALLFCAGIGTIALAWKIASKIGSED